MACWCKQALCVTNLHTLRDPPFLRSHTSCVYLPPLLSYVPSCMHSTPVPSTLPSPISNLQFHPAQASKQHLAEMQPEALVHSGYALARNGHLPSNSYRKAYLKALQVGVWGGGGRRGVKHQA